ncbi:NAD(P)-dependent dehydrogenase, short-chain alcohol dehydrogenase family [Methylobacillus rhizosphaerae]|uniref:NAD(P)-dependent dehydrogenase, short-chain alcohol dehydrogenase family n=1 Tax=Methylobacillus rhizosphaerae TaxID=551994 RepID=A0A239AK71_9PROT|nr:SDR family oxidoreductase [Methylobacillus rhizosphaerae]SNR96075.1 NAD(P)-dependent dehydrogenase, short-chain alcohol dehydrogenase family [Methylobacillus rhizosphaerae]
MSQKIGLVTGGSRGLGKNTALAMAAKGIDVILTYHSQHTSAQAVVAEITAMGRKAAALQLDVTDSSGFKEFSQQIATLLQTNWQTESLDYVVNNAGTGIYAPFAETTEEQFDQMVNTHLKSVFFLTQKLLPLIRNGGRIVNLSSGLARFAMPGYSAYAAMKGGIEVLTRYMAKELGARQIAVNTVAPGAIETDFGQGVVRDNQDINAHIASQTAMGRVGLPDDIGPMIASLLSEDNRWVNAQRIEVSGGMLI